jgi:hypothetical protein
MEAGMNEVPAATYAEEQKFLRTGLGSAVVSLHVFRRVAVVACNAPFLLKLVKLSISRNCSNRIASSRRAFRPFVSNASTIYVRVVREHLHPSHRWIVLQAWHWITQQDSTREAISAARNRPSPAARQVLAFRVRNEPS